MATPLDIEPPFLVIQPGRSEEDFYRLAGEDSDWEYLDGRIVMHSPASRRHEDLFAFLMTLVRAFIGEKGGATVLGSRYPMRLDPKWSPEPDLLVVRDARREILTPQRLEGPADLVVEIASESDPGLDLREKLPRYREAGIEEIWLVDPFAKSVRVETKEGEGYESRAVSSGKLPSKFLPGFWIDVSWLFGEELPAPLGCLREIL